MNHPPKAAPHRRAHLLAAAGLLHDAGKVGEPADIALHPTIANLEQQICRSDPQGRAQYRHVLFSAQLMHEAEEQGCNFGGLDFRELFHLVAYHHQQFPDDLDDCLLKKADWLASGHDRRTAETTDAKAQVVTGLWPILASLSWPDPQATANSAGARQVLPTRTLSFAQTAFLPVPAQDRAAYCEGCRSVWTELQRACGGTFRDPADYVGHLSALAQRTLQAIPASRAWGQQADVALYDHVHIVAALAACLAVLHDPTGVTAGVREPNRIEGRYRLVGLGLGGIQRFIFRCEPPLDAAPGETAERGMARLLRARSFYVSLLTTLAAQRLLDATGLPVVNLMFDGGGRSILLLPDDETTMARVQEALDYMDRWFASRLAGDLRLDVAVSPRLADADFTQEAFGATIRQAHRELAEARLRLPEMGLSGPEGWADDGWREDQPSLPVDRAEFRDALEGVGRALPKARFLSLDAENEGGIASVLDIFGYKVRLHDGRPDRAERCFALGLGHLEPTTPLLLAACQVPVAEADDVARLAAGSGNGNGRSEELPERPGEILTFGQLARLAEDEQREPLGHGMLGALKADVDRLGMLLGYGLGEAVSLGRFASVARILDQFFKGFLGEQLAEHYRHVYTIFAGGDDLFLIGPWYDLARLLAGLHGWFRRITCNSTNITLSAGLVFSQPTTPVRHLAWLAGEALEQAKETGRDRVTFASTTMTWPQYHAALELHRLMRDLASPEGGDTRPVLRSAMVYRFLQYANMAISSARLGATARLPDLKWRAQLSYDLKRNLPAPGDAYSALGRLHRTLADIHSAEEAAVLRTAATLTLYFLRGGKS